MDQGLESADVLESYTEPEVIHIDTMRHHRQMRRLQEWFGAQMPWNRSVAREVSRRLREAA